MHSQRPTHLSLGEEVVLVQQHKFCWALRVCLRCSITLRGPCSVRVAWKHRVHRNEYRENKLLNDPGSCQYTNLKPCGLLSIHYDFAVYKNTAGYEVQWSQQEGVNARRCKYA